MKGGRCRKQPDEEQPGCATWSAWSVRSAGPENLREALSGLRKKLGERKYQPLRRAFNGLDTQALLNRLMPEEPRPELNNLEEMEASARRTRHGMDPKMEIGRTAGKEKQEAKLAQCSAILNRRPSASARASWTSACRTPRTARRTCWTSGPNATFDAKTIRRRSPSSSEPLFLTFRLTCAVFSVLPAFQTTSVGPRNRFGSVLADRWQCAWGRFSCKGSSYRCMPA